MRILWFLLGVLVALAPGTAETLVGSGFNVSYQPYLNFTAFSQNVTVSCPSCTVNVTVLPAYHLYTDLSCRALNASTTAVSGPGVVTVTFFNTSCPPGRYLAYVNFTDSTNASNSLTANFTVDVPFTPGNQILNNTWIVNGTRTGAVYYLNVSGTENYTQFIFYFTNTSSGEIEALLKGPNTVQKVEGTGFILHRPVVPGLYELSLRASGENIGFLFLSTLNTSNASGLETGGTDLGTLVPGERKTFNFTIVNKGLLAYDLRRVSFPLFFMNETRSPSDNFTEIMIPAISLVKVGVYPEGKFNFTVSGPGFTYGPVPSLSFYATPGIWNISVKNYSSENYTLSVAVYYDPASLISGMRSPDWLELNGTSFTVGPLDRVFVNGTLTASAPMSGRHMILLFYVNKTELVSMFHPVVFNISSGELSVNGFVREMTYTIYQNLAPLSRTFRFTVKNTGNLNFTLVSGSPNASVTSRAPATLNPGESGILNVTLNFSDLIITGNYGFLVYLNASRALPSDTFLLKLNVTITLGLNVSMLNVTNSSAFVQVLYANLTPVTDLGKSNFTLKAVHMNASFVGLPEVLGVSGSGNYSLNFSTADLPGGVYMLGLLAERFHLLGDDDRLIYVSNPGFYPYFVKRCDSVRNGSECVVNVSVRNYGERGSVGLDLSLDGKLSVTSSGSSCASGSGLNVEVPAGGVCYVWWVLKAGSSTGTARGWINLSSKFAMRNLTFATTIYSVSSSSGFSSQPSSQPPPEPEEGLEPSLSIIDYPSEIQIERGNSKEVEIKVRNTGRVYLRGVHLEVKGINESWFSSEDSWSIPSGVPRVFTVRFEIPKSAEPGRYEIEFEARNDKASDSVESALVVLPDKELREEIEKNLSAIRKTLESIEGGNVSEVRVLVERAEEFVSTGDYLSAYRLLPNITSALQELTANETEKLGSQVSASRKEGFPILPVVVFVAAGVVGLIVYLLLPPPHGYEPEEGFRYVPPEERNKPRIKKLIERIKGVVKKNDDQGRVS